MATAYRLHSVKVPIKTRETGENFVPAKHYTNEFQETFYRFFNCTKSVCFLGGRVA